MKATKKLGELPATAICGNDISSSCLYVSALAITHAGQYAWLALLIVAAVLALFRRIYGEVVGALPLNGGAYNALLNTTSKSKASLAAALTVLSYMATAVISASEAIHYVAVMAPGVPITPLIIALLAGFLLLTIIGIGESSRVAVAIFVFHLCSLLLLSVVCLGYVLSEGVGTLSMNMAQPLKGDLLTALFFGFCVAMLGISGFESSANFVEEQQKGVFPKTLRNMWIVVSVFNPLMALLAIAVLPLAQIGEHHEALLSHMGLQTGGQWLSLVISIDAALVLSGAVLTSYVGVAGLVERMTLDRVLPQFLLRKNKRGSSYVIMIVFFLLACSVLVITRGELGALAGVYTISFLSVMLLFGLGNIYLKIRRNRLPRPVRASWLSIFAAMAAVLAALVGNAILNPHYVVVFLEYFIPAMIVVLVMLNRIVLLRMLMLVSRHIIRLLEKTLLMGNHRILAVIERINAQEFVFFTKDDDVATLNKVMLYITNNEHTRKLKIVTFFEGKKRFSSQLERDIEVLDREYPEVDIEYHQLRGKFGPDEIHNLSKKWKIPRNFMFIGSPGDHFPFSIEQLGGVRLII